MFDSISFFRVCKSGLVNFWRNKWLSVAATSVMVVTLIIISVLAALFLITNYSVNAIKQKVDISVYLNAGVPESKIDLLRKELSENSMIREVNYVSADQALETFKAQHEGDEVILESLEELSENPLPATLQIKAFDIEKYTEIAAEIENSPNRDIINKINFEDNRLLIERLGKILDIIIRVGIILVLIFSVIAVLVVFNTITLTIYNRREEVEIMRLVGATNMFIRGPFIVEAILYSLVAAVITTAISAYVLSKLIPQFNVLLGNNSLSEVVWLKVPVIGLGLLLVALVLSIISSSLAIRKYLKV